MGAGERSVLGQAPRAFDEPGHALVATRPERLDEATVLDQLSDEWRAHLWRRGRDNDGVVRCSIRQAERPITHDQGHVANLGGIQILARLLGDIGKPLHRDNLATQTRQDRGLEAEASADLQNTRLIHDVKRLDHEREQRRLGRDLLVGDAQGHVVVRAVPPLGRSERRSRYASEGREQTLVTDAGVAEDCDEMFGCCRDHAPS